MNWKGLKRICIHCCNLSGFILQYLWSKCLEKKLRKLFLWYIVVKTFIQVRTPPSLYTSREIFVFFSSEKWFSEGLKWMWNELKKFHVLFYWKNYIKCIHTYRLFLLYLIFSFPNKMKVSNLQMTIFKIAHKETV